MNDNQTLELQLKTVAEQATNAINKLNNSINKIDTTVNKTTNSVNKFGKAFSTTSLYYGVQRLTTQFLKWMDLAVDRTEQLNLFNVVFKNVEKNGVQTFSTLGKEAIKFQNKLNEAFGTNLTETLKYQGLFQSMGENVGIDSYYSAIMSETMTKLTYDLASLYNKSESTTAEAIRAGVYAGQTKPLRSYGIDVTQTSMQPILESLGITDRSVKQMSQAEKEILRYLATLKQAQVAMGDYANTIESPANQMKVFKQQLIESKVALTSLFIGGFANILPYANALLMVVTEVAKAIADMFGIELQDYNSGIASSEDAYDNLADSIDGATDSVKELKRQTLGFDQIHNINENNDNGSGSNLTGGIDQRLLDAIYGYDNGMDKVRMKATEIRDRIMEWLGFTKEINPLTGEVGFKLKDGETRFGSILGIINDAKGILQFIWDHADIFFKTIISYKILTGLTNIINKLTKVSDICGKLSVSKWALGITGGIALADIISSTDWYQDLTGNKGTVTEMFGQILQGEADLAQTNAINKEQLKNQIYRSLMLGEKYSEKGIDNKDVFSHYMDLYNTYNDRYATYNPITGMKNNPAQEIVDYYKAHKDEIKEAFEISKIDFGQMYNNGGIGIADYKTKLDEWANSLVNATDLTTKYNAVIEQSKQSYSDAEEELSILLTKMSTNQYEITADDIQQVTDAINKMKQAQQDCCKAFTDATTSIVNHLVEEGLIAQETASQVVKSTFIKQKVALGYTEEYAKAIAELNEKYSKGEIDQKQYITKQMELSQQFDKTTDWVKKANISFTNLSDTLIIDGQNWSTLNDTVSKLGETYQENEQKIKDSAKSNQGMLEETQLFWEENKQAILDNGTTIEEYNEIHTAIKDSILANNQDELNSINDLKTGYAVSMLQILQQMKDSKLDITDEGKEIVESLETEFSKMGIEVDLTQDMDEIKKQLSAKGIEIGTALGNSISSSTKFKGTGIFNGWNDVVSKLWNTASKLTGSIFGFKLPSLSSLKIPMFANGGFPEDGLFFANHNELVGNFSNGKTAVANNAQIIEGIKAGVYDAVVSAMNQSSGQASQIDVHLHTDEGVVVDKINQITKQTGVFPLNIPI